MTVSRSLRDVTGQSLICPRPHLRLREFAQRSDILGIAQQNNRGESLSKSLHAFAIICGILWWMPNAVASSFVGTTTDVIVQPSPTTSGAIRVSIIVPTAVSSCSNPTAFAYEYSGTDLGKTWTALLLAAQAAARQVEIDGSGTCDQYGVEVLSVMRLF